MPELSKTISSIKKAEEKNIEQAIEVFVIHHKAMICKIASSKKFSTDVWAL